MGLVFSTEMYDFLFQATASQYPIKRNKPEVEIIKIIELFLVKWKLPYIFYIRINNIMLEFHVLFSCFMQYSSKVSW